jgi:hypothetical protein
MNSPFSLWLEYEHLIPTEADDPENDLCNIQLTLPDGTIYALNVWTYKFVQRAIAQAQRDGENLDGQYLEPTDLFVERLDRKLLEAVFADLIRRDCLLEQWKVVPDAQQ